MAAFIAGRIPFPAIANIVMEALDTVPVQEPETIADVMDADAAARTAAGAAIGVVSGSPG